MARKEFVFKGKTLEELQQLSIAEFANLIPASQRRSLVKGLTHAQKKLLEKLEKGKDRVKTHARQMVILPIMAGKTIGIYSGNKFVDIVIQPEMIGHRLGEFVDSRKRVGHSAPGIGATKSTSSISVK